MANYKRHKPKQHEFGEWADELWRASGNDRCRFPARDLRQPQFYPANDSHQNLNPWRYTKKLYDCD